jgi:hypothetical protein
MVDALRAHFDSQVPGILNSVAASPARTRDQLIAELARHPIFESARRCRENELIAYDPPLLRDFLSTRRVLRRSEAPWGLILSDPAVERAASLMAANSATHSSSFRTTLSTSSCLRRLSFPPIRPPKPHRRWCGACWR